MTIFETAVTETRLQVFRSKIRPDRKAKLLQVITTILESSRVGGDSVVSNPPDVDLDLHKSILKRAREKTNV